MVDAKKLKRPNPKGTPPMETETRHNLEKAPSGQNVPLTLKISPELRREIKGYANDHDLKINELIARVWEYYKEHHG